MEFGALEGKELEQADLSLPPDHPDSSRQFTGKTGAKIFIGCAKWGRPEWVGSVYPAGTKEKDYLKHYVQNFNSIELNTTFYSIKKANVEKWAAEASGDFRFCPKFGQRISHIKRLKDVQGITEYYIDCCGAFGKHFGAAFLQMPDNFGPKRFDDLRNYLESLPEDFRLFVEFRHKDWFADPAAFDETFSMLADLGFGAVITDVAGRRDVMHMRLTVPRAFIRFNGYGLLPSDYSRMDEWATRIKTWMAGGMEEIYFFGHQMDEAHTPATCAYMIRKLNEVAGTKLKLPAGV
jgi:uncharacterized protein YecE (DUF72 family)